MFGALLGLILIDIAREKGETARGFEMIKILTDRTRRSSLPTLPTIATIVGASTLAGCKPLAGGFGSGLGRALGAAVTVLVIALFVGLLVELLGFALVLRGCARQRPALIASGLAIGACALVLHLMFAIAVSQPSSKDTSTGFYLCLLPFATVVSGVASLVGSSSRSTARKALAVAVGSAIVGAGGIQVLERHIHSPSPPLSGNVRALAIGRAHACVLAEDGTVSCGGNNLAGQLGAKHPFDSWPMEPVPGMRGAHGIATGDQFSCALVDDGLTCWGRITWFRDDAPDAGATKTYEESPPTLIVKTPGLRELYARGDTIAWRLAEGRVVIHEGVYFTRGEVPVPSDTTQFVVSRRHYCYRTSAGRVGCRSLSRESERIVADTREIVFPKDDAKKIEIADDQLCVERTASIECSDLWDRKPSKSDATADDVGPPGIALDARHMATTDGAVCGGLGTKIVCVSLSKYEPGRRELDVGASVIDLTSGVGGYCARLESGAFACFDAFDCFDAWVRHDACTPRVHSSPVRTPTEAVE